MIWRIVFSPETLATAVHTESCSAAAPVLGSRLRARGKRVTYTVEADSAAAAARQVYEDDAFEERRIAMPKICPCCK